MGRNGKSTLSRKDLLNKYGISYKDVTNLAAKIRLHWSLSYQFYNPVVGGRRVGSKLQLDILADIPDHNSSFSFLFSLRGKESPNVMSTYRTRLYEMLSDMDDRLMEVLSR